MQSMYLIINFYLLVSTSRSHEWLKHGTCSDMDTESAYFSTVLKIFEGGLNFGDVLEKAGVTPSKTDTYTVSSLPYSSKMFRLKLIAAK